MIRSGPRTLGALVARIPNARRCVGPTRARILKDPTHDDITSGIRRAPVSRARSASEATPTEWPLRRSPAIVPLGFDLPQIQAPQSILQGQWSKRPDESERHVQCLICIVDYAFNARIASSGVEVVTPDTSAKPTL